MCPVPVQCGNPSQTAERALYFMARRNVEPSTELFLSLYRKNQSPWKITMSLVVHYLPFFLFVIGYQRFNSDSRSSRCENNRMKLTFLLTYPLKWKSYVHVTRGVTKLKSGFQSHTSSKQVFKRAQKFGGIARFIRRNESESHMLPQSKYTN